MDPANSDNNDWLAVNPFTVVENKRERRPDVVLFVNGLPPAVMDLKNTADENAIIQKFLPAIKGDTYPLLSAACQGKTSPLNRIIRSYSINHYR